MTQTPSAATSIVTIVGPRPTFCWPSMAADHTEAMVRILLLLMATFSPAAPAADEPIPRSPATLSARLAEVDTQMRSHVRGDITLEALYEQRVYRHLARHPRLERAVRRRLPARMRPDVRDTVSALRSLFTLTTYSTERRFLTGPPTPRDDLRRYYREAQRRFGMPWNVLAAI